jgi:CRP/FNR family transcriptional regulator, cyclic AMP receptor protein
LRVIYNESRERGHVLVPLREEIRLLSVTDILEPLSEEELLEFAERNPDIRLEQGEFLFTQDEPAETLYVLKQGRIQLHRTTPEGQEITLAIATRGDVFGEMAFTAQRLWGMHAKALRPSLLVSLSREDLKELIRKNPEVGVRLVERLSERLRLREEQLADLATKDVPARLASLILRLLKDEGVRTAEGYKIPSRYTHEQLSTMIGAKRVAVSRAFKKLRQTGAVEVRGRILYIGDLETLKRAAQEE